MPKRCLINNWDILRYAKDLQKLLAGVANMSKIYVKDMPRKCSKYAQDPKT